MYILGVIRQSILHNSTGGMELVSHDLYKGLVSLGYNVEVLTSSFDDKTSDILLDGVKYIFIKEAPRGVYSDELHNGVKAYLDSIINNKRPFVIHSVSGAAKAVTKNPYKIPVIATWHGTNIEQELDKMMSYKYIDQKTLLPSHCERLLLGFSNNTKLRSEFQSFDGHIAISPFMRDCIISYGVEESKITVIKNALPDVFSNTSEYSVKFQKPKNKILLGLVGRAIPMKGHVFFNQVLNKLEPEKYELIIIGGNQQESKEIFKNANVKVHFLSVERNYMPSIYSLIDIYINPTFRYSGFDLTVQEALSSGCIVLNSDVGPYKYYYNELQNELKENSPFFTFKVGDVNSCVGAINRILVNQVRNNSSAFFIKDFGIQTMLKRYVDFFQKIK